MPAFKLAVIPVTAFQQNCTLIWEPDTMRAIVLDPGGDADRILDGIGKLGLKVEMLLLTHGHLDHAGGAKSVKEALDVARAAEGASPVPLVGPDIRDRFLLEGIEEAQVKFGMTDLRNVQPDRWLTEGETIALGALRFDILHVPGHTPGSLVFVEKTQRFALVGDTLFRGSVGRTDFPYGDGEQLIAEIKAKILPLGDDVAFICGHGPASTIGQERASNPFLQG
jgi:hydroxyacylglutathione hydrolase